MTYSQQARTAFKRPIVGRGPQAQRRRAESYTPSQRLRQAAAERYIAEAQRHRRGQQEDIEDIIYSTPEPPRDANPHSRRAPAEETSTFPSDGMDANLGRQNSGSPEVERAPCGLEAENANRNQRAVPGEAENANRNQNAVPGVDTRPLDASRRIVYDCLVEENVRQRADQRDSISSMKVLSDAYKLAVEQLRHPEYLDVKHVKVKLKSIIKKILFDSGEFSNMYPTEDTMLEAVLMSFDIDTDRAARAELMKEWSAPDEGIRTIVIRRFRSRQAQMGAVAKKELFRLLRIPELPENALAAETAEREAERERLCIGDAWRRKTFSDGPEDPFGSAAIFGAVAKSMCGQSYQVDIPVYITLQQAGWFFQKLDLAMHNRNLNNQNREKDHAAMAVWEEIVLTNISKMRRIMIHSLSGGDFADSPLDF